MSRYGEPRARSAPRIGLGLLAAVAALAILVPAEPAAAHAELLDSQPANGAVLAQAPQSVVLRFSEDISPKFSSATLLDSHGRTVPRTRIDPAGGDPRRLVLTLPRLTAETYGVAWRVLAEDDGHTTAGVVVFTVGNTSQAPGGQALQALESGGGMPPLDVARRWLGLCLLAGLIGGLVFAAAVLRPFGAGPDDPVSAAVAVARRRVLSVAAWCGAAAAAVGFADLVAQAGRSGAGGSALATLLLDTRWGALWAMREAVLVAVTALAFTLRSALRAPEDRDTQRWIVAGLLAATIVTLDALSGHAASTDSTVAVLAVAAHAFTAYVWLGGLAALVVTAAPPGGPGATRTDLLRALRGRFGTLAAGSVVLVVATGLYSAGREVATPGDLLHTSYGRVVIAKGVLLLVVGGLGLANAARLHGWPPRSPRPPSRRLLAAEAVAGAVLLLAAGLLVETPPARTGSARPTGVPPAVADSGTADDILVTASVTPGQPGSNAITVIAVSSRRPPPAPIDAVTLQIEGAGPAALREIEPGRYFGTAELPVAGTVRATAVLLRAGKRFTVPISWPVRAPAPAPAQPANTLAPITTTAAVLIICVLFAAGAWRVRAVRRRRAVPQRDDVEPAILEDAR